MKKLGVVCFIFICFLATGCIKNESGQKGSKGESVLTCSKSMSSGVNFITEMSYYFKGEKLSKLGVKYVYDLSSYSEAQRNAFTSAKMCEMDSVKNDLGMKDCKEELVGTDYIVTGFAEKLLQQSSGALKDIQSSLEGAEWTCSVQ